MGHVVSIVLSYRMQSKGKLTLIPLNMSVYPIPFKLTQPYQFPVINRLYSELKGNAGLNRSGVWENLDGDRS